MCLFPFGGGGFNMQPVCPPSQSALAMKRNLYIVLFIHLVLALTLFFTTGAGGLQDLILVLILWCGISQMHYCHILIYIFMSLFNWISFVSAIGLMLQNGSFFSQLGKGGQTTFVVLLVLAFTVFYPSATYVTFKAYKEFKGMAYDNGMGGAGGGLGNMMPFRGSSRASNDGGVYQ